MLNHRRDLVSHREYRMLSILHSVKSHAAERDSKTFYWKTLGEIRSCTKNLSYFMLDQSTQHCPNISQPLKLWHKIVTAYMMRISLPIHAINSAIVRLFTAPGDNWRHIKLHRHHHQSTYGLYINKGTNCNKDYVTPMVFIKLIMNRNIRLRKIFSYINKWNFFHLVKYCIPGLLEILPLLSHWGLSSHIFGSKLGCHRSGNSLSPVRYQAITLNDVWLLLIRPKGIERYFNYEIPKASFWCRLENSGHVIYTNSAPIHVISNTHTPFHDIYLKATRRALNSPIHSWLRVDTQTFHRWIANKPGASSAKTWIWFIKKPKITFNHLLKWLLPFTIGLSVITITNIV